MSSREECRTILIAEDDDDDFFLTTQAVQEARLPHELRRVCDGQELLDYLHHRRAFGPPASSPLPSLILLDLNMPRMSGVEALREIKGDEDLRSIPIIALTTSRAEEDILHSYRLGVNSFVIKPLTFPGLVKVVKVLGLYWFETAELPAAQSRRDR